MPTVSVKKFNTLTANKHTELAQVLINGDTHSVPDPNGINVFRIDAEEPHELFTHNTFDILDAMDCNAEVKLCGKSIQMKKYNIIFIAPEVPYRVSVSGNNIMPVISVRRDTVGTHFHRISVFGGVLSGFIADSVWGEVSADYLLFSSLSDTGVDTVINMLINEELHGGPNSRIMKTQLLICLFGYLCARPSSTYELSKTKISRSEQIAKILTYIQDNYRTVTLEKLAESFHYTVPYVSKLVRSATGLTFTEILREIKFDVCRSLLLNSDLKINKIAEVAGFQNTDHFNRVFKKHMGITPTEFKKKKSIDK